MYQLCEQILIFFGRNVTNKLSNQKTVYFVTSNNLCFYTNLQNGEMRKLHFALKCWISALPEFEPVAAWFLQSYSLTIHAPAAV